jgi:hypothetical protein
MLYKRKIKNTNLVSENRNVFISTWDTQWVLNTVGWPWFYDYYRRGVMLYLDFFRQMGSLLRGRIFGVCFTLEESHTDPIHIHA